MKRILMIAYHFPPLAGSSGIQRTLRFVQHLPAFGWQPLVLSAHPRAYERTSDDLLADVPTGTVVERAFALDTSRHLSLKGRHFGWMARPDRWVSWKFAAVRTGMRMIERYKPDAIWSTYPIATAHLIGNELHRRSGLPWVADFRDPMAQEGYPRDPKTWQQFSDIESKAIAQASYSVFTTPGASRIYRERYPAHADRIVTLENGYDEETFSSAGTQTSPLNPGGVTLLHSGIVYPGERDPTQLFAAMAKLKHQHRIPAGRLKIRFRAAVHEQLLATLAERYDVADMTEIMPAVPYRAAIAEMLSADGLLIMQAADCNEQIPAKLYEYLRANRPILALTDHRGDTALTLRNAGVSCIADLTSPDEIAARLIELVESLAATSVPAACLPTAEAIRQASRKERSAQLAALLDTIGRA